jgi:hypothetical protein
MQPAGSRRELTGGGQCHSEAGPTARYRDMIKGQRYQQPGPDLVMLAEEPDDGSDGGDPLTFEAVVAATAPDAVLSAPQHAGRWHGRLGAPRAIPPRFVLETDTHGDYGTTPYVIRVTAGATTKNFGPWTWGCMPREQEFTMD